MLIDTHCHLDYLDDIPQALQRAKEKNVEIIIIPASSLPSAYKTLELIRQYPNLYAGVGLHPFSENDTYRQELDQSQLGTLEDMLMHKTAKIVAVGETGLDFSQDPTQQEKAVQIDLFKHHLHWAKKYRLPVIIHNRKAGQELMDCLTENGIYSEIAGVFHCFTGSKKFLQKVLGLGFYIGVGGLVTVDEGLQQVIKEAPLDRIVMETDTPYLTPLPVRNTQPWPNEPANVVYSALKLAQIKGISLDEVEKITTMNARRLFNLAGQN